MTNWADDLRTAGLDPVRDWRDWNEIRLWLEFRENDIDVSEYVRLATALSRASKLTDFEAAYLPYLDPSEGSDSRHVPPKEWKLPENTPASIRQCEDECPRCDKAMVLHPDLRRAQVAGRLGSRKMSDEAFEQHLGRLAEKKVRHTSAGHPTYVCTRCDNQPNG
jgi:hypothetical protein